MDDIVTSAAGRATCGACGAGVSLFVTAGAARFCHPCALARLAAPPPAEAAALVEDARRLAPDLDAIADTLHEGPVFRSGDAEIVSSAGECLTLLAAALAAQTHDLAAARDSRDKFKAALAAEEERHMETARELDDLRADIEEHLSAYVLDDGTDDEANPRERVEYVGVEIKRLRARLDEVTRERDEARAALAVSRG